MHRGPLGRYVVPGIAVLGIGLAAAVIYAAPLITLYRIKVAADAADNAQLERLIDFPAVRASAKAVVRQKLTERLGDPEGHSALRSIGKSLGNALGGSAVDWLLTPQGLSRLIRGQARASSGGGTGLGAIPEVHFGYQSSTAFELAVRERRPDAVPVVLTLHRDGWAWRLVAVRLP